MLLGLRAGQSCRCCGKQTGSHAIEVSGIFEIVVNGTEKQLIRKKRQKNEKKKRKKTGEKEGKLTTKEREKKRKRKRRGKRKGKDKRKEK